MMKIVILSLLLISLVVGLRPPGPYCRSSPLPAVVPIAINSTIRYDLEGLFDGYNLQFKGLQTDHIKISPKYQVNKMEFEHSFNFTTAKIKANNRFLGLIINEERSDLVIGTNHPESGVAVDKIVMVQDIPNMHCYDVDEIYGRDQSFAVIDCGTFRMGELVENHFFFVNLDTGDKILGGKTYDSFVKYNKLTKRNIQVIEDPFNRILYILRIIPRDGVDTEHQDQTYIQLFMIRNAVDPQIIDVIDHTFIDQTRLSIVDYQVIFGQLYVLAYNRGLYEIAITRDQRFQIRSFFQIKMDMHKFRVDRLGFNDDLHIAMTNGNQIYTYEWDVLNPPKLIQKYGLPANSQVQQLVASTEFVIVTARTQFDGVIERRHWVFSRMSTSYTHAFNVFSAPQFGPAIMQFSNDQSILYLFHEYTTYNIKISLPFLEINPVDPSKAGQKETYLITAISYDPSDPNVNITCQQNLVLLFQAHNDSSIIKTGFFDKAHLVVDSPDEFAINLGYEFNGRNLAYNFSFQLNSSIVPHTYVDKVHRAIFTGANIDPAKIVFYQVFSEMSSSETTPKSVYSLVQESNDAKNSTINSYITHYVHCEINVLDRDETHYLNCKIISSNQFSMGKIIKSSQMFDPKQRRLALVFDGAPNTVMIYYLWAAGFGFYGRKDYNADAWNILTGITITKGKLICTLENSKRIEIFNIQDLRQPTDIPRNSSAVFVIDSRIVRFFNIQYWAPVETKVSPFHNQVVFVKTKVGVMAMNINEMGFPELLFTIPTSNIRYDFQVNQNSLLIITQSHTEIWHLYTPLRRVQPPFIREYLEFKYSIGEYDEVTADKLFYIVRDKDVVVGNPELNSNNIVYLVLKFNQTILNIDTVNIEGRQLLFVHTKTQIIVHVIRQTPMLYVKWPAYQHDFNLSMTAYNEYNNHSQPYTLLFEVLLSDETEIKPTQKFNATDFKQIGHVRARQNQDRTFNFNITLNDTEWFEGNVFYYSLNCSSCDSKQSIEIVNHVQQVQQLVTGRAIYDMQSTFNGIYAQQYSSFIKTWPQNDSIQLIQPIPTVNRGQVCSKVAINDYQDYVISLCQTGQQVNVYVTTFISDKPFTMGPYATQAKAVNYAKVVDDILMIVDNQDDPFARNGGIYLYSLQFSEDDLEISMIDLIDNSDLQIQGFRGMAAIGSADLHDSHGIKQYRLMITDSFSGNLFIFSFQLSPDSQQIVYLSKKLVDIRKYLPDHVKAPMPLRILTVNIHYYISHDQDKTAQYYLIFTVANWHHFQLYLSVDRYDNIKSIRLLRMFQRIPWTLGNYFRVRRSWQRSQFAVPYIDYENAKQVIAIYQADFIVVINATQSTTNDDLVQIPFIKILGVHRVRDIYEVAFAFHSRGLDTLLFTDFDGENITELAINQNVTLVVKNLAQPQQVNITAHNPYNNFTFSLQVQFIDQDMQQKIQYIWIILLCIGSLMIVSLIIIWAKQKNDAKKTSKHVTKAPVPEGKESLITVDDQFKGDYINRTSVDPESIRNTLDMGLTDSLLNSDHRNQFQDQHQQGQSTPEVSQTQMRREQ